ncbi:MAG: hypothetical protein WDW38_002639 [Sanguina aurantia]
MLVCVGSALAVIVSAYGFSHALQQDHVVLDPSRIAAQVISGIGFLGAGTILFLQKEQVIRGLTTAAGLWAVAAVGLAAGTGLFFAAIAATLILWIILALLKPVERRFIIPRKKYASIQITITHGAALSAVEAVMADFHAPVERMLLRRDADGQDTVTVRFDVSFPPEKLASIADAVAQSFCGSWAFLKFKPAHLLDQLPAHISLRLPTFRANEICMVVNCYTQSRHLHSELLQTVATALVRRHSEFSPQDISLLLHAFGTFSLTPREPGFLDTLCRATALRTFHFQPRAIVMVVKALARLGVRSPRLYGDLCQAAREKLSDFHPQELAGLLFALSLTVVPEVVATPVTAPQTTAKQAASSGATPHAGTSSSSSSSSKKRRGPAGDWLCCSTVGCSGDNSSSSPPAQVDLVLYQEVVNQCIRILQDPENQWHSKISFHVLNSVVQSCQKVGYMPWTLIDFAESQGIHVRTYNNSEEAAAAPAETSKPSRPQRYLNRGSYSEVHPSNSMFSAITGGSQDYDDQDLEFGPADDGGVSRAIQQSSRAAAEKRRSKGRAGSLMIFSDNTTYSGSTAAGADGDGSTGRGSKSRNGANGSRDASSSSSNGSNGLMSAPVHRPSSPPPSSPGTSEAPEDSTTGHASSHAPTSPQSHAAQDQQHSHSSVNQNGAEPTHQPTRNTHSPTESPPAETHQDSSSSSGSSSAGNGNGQGSWHVIQPPSLPSPGEARRKERREADGKRQRDLFAAAALDVHDTADQQREDGSDSPPMTRFPARTDLTPGQLARKARREAQGKERREREAAAAGLML